MKIHLVIITSGVYLLGAIGAIGMIDIGIEMQGDPNYVVDRMGFAFLSFGILGVAILGTLLAVLFRSPVFKGETACTCQQQEGTDKVAQAGSTDEKIVSS